VPRHLFVPGIRHLMAYTECALLITHGQSISRPYIVAFMSEKLALSGTRTSW